MLQLLQIAGAFPILAGSALTRLRLMALRSRAYLGHNLVGGAVLAGPA